MKNLISFISIALISVCVFAQPQKMSYQAVIRNNNQLVVNQVVGMQLSILQGSASGAVVYTETQTPTTNSNGLVSIEIGIAAGFDAIDWSNGPYFLKTETDPTGGTNYTVSGITQLLSVPYSLFSKTAASYSETDPVFQAHPSSELTAGNITNWNTAFNWGNHALAGYLSSENDAITGNEITNTTNSTLTRFGSGTQASPYTIGLNLSNSNTWSASQTFTGSTFFPGTGIWNSSGNVGIGTTAPSAKLEVIGQMKITGGTPAAGQVLTSDASGLATWEPVPVPAVNQIYFEVKRDANFDWPVLGSIQKIDFSSNSTVWENTGNGFNQATSTFTAPEAGIYNFSGTISFSNLSGGGYLLYAFITAGGKNYNGPWKYANGASEGADVNVTVYLSAGQTVQLWGYVNDDVAPATVYGNSSTTYAFTYFTGAKVR